MMREPRWKDCNKCFGKAYIGDEECDYCDGTGEIEKGDFWEPADGYPDTWKEAVGIA